MTLLWLALGLALVTAIGRGFWLYRASLTWPTADGVITRLDVDRQHDPGAHGEVRKRCLSQPTEHQRILLQRLGMRLPMALEQAQM